MRVSIKYDERAAGIIFHRTDIYQIWTIEFSDEEKAIVRQRRLGNVTIHNMWIYPVLISPIIKQEPLFSKLPLIGPVFVRAKPNVTVSDLLAYRVFIYKWSTATEAKEFEQEICDNLEALKDMIVHNKDVGRDTVFEL